MSEHGRNYPMYSAPSPYHSQWSGPTNNAPAYPTSPTSSYHSQSPVSPHGGQFSQESYVRQPQQYPAHHPQYQSSQGYSYATMNGTPEMYAPYPDQHGPSHFQSNGAYPSAHYGAETQYEDTDSYTDRPFQCDLCSLSFNRGHDLKRHRETHRGDKPFSCNGGCGKTFTRKDALKRHQIVKNCGMPDSDS
ncbi:hypothetical protein DL96DRAFT_1160797 [Flagelloscypha sp. PMI_526]|nr:hypothetical protein DL96DRAFT_1160797 [Flagelloscypha sp. PMI_526]